MWYFLLSIRLTEQKTIQITYIMNNIIQNNFLPDNWICHLHHLSNKLAQPYACPVATKNTFSRLKRFFYILNIWFVSLLHFSSLSRTQAHSQISLGHPYSWTSSSPVVGWTICLSSTLTLTWHNAMRHAVPSACSIHLMRQFSHCANHQPNRKINHI